MTSRSVVVIGLPGSGKTTFLAALWHLVTVREVPTVLRFDSLGRGDSTHLNAIAARWRDARVQERTAVGGNQIVSINLKSVSDAALRVVFPDTAGESYARMWEERECDEEVANSLASECVMLFIHADTIRPPRWIVDDVALSRALGLPVPQNGEVPWHPRLAPTQVQLVELLQLLQAAPLGSGHRRLTIMFSAWDKVDEEGLAPDEFLRAKLPLLAQYLKQNTGCWTVRSYGLSAQGGDYESDEPNQADVEKAEELRSVDQPSRRIRLLGNGTETHDLTEPLAWLLR